MNTRQTITGSIVVTTFALLAVAGTSLLAGSPTPTPAFPHHTNLAAPESLPTDGWTGGPYECDATVGITTSCVFPD